MVLPGGAADPVPHGAVLAYPAGTAVLQRPGTAVCYLLRASYDMSSICACSYYREAYLPTRDAVLRYRMAVPGSPSPARF
eukprot:3940483-Rhodomonas_salina.2